MKRFFFLALVGLSINQSCDYKPRNQGKALYAQHCQSCHMDSGEGLGKLFPPVKNSDYLLANTTELACLIRHGIDGEISVNGIDYDGQMAGNRQLTDVEITNLVHYILVDMNGQEKAFTAIEVKAQLDQCPIE
jgi:mono/diheme cytochrome c family protein